MHSPFKYSERFDSLVRLTLLGNWVAKYRPNPYLKTREQLYEYLAENIIGDRVISLIEFGVYLGASLRFWTNLNTNTSSEFYGFDSFEGLPADWVNITSTLSEGTFSTDGKYPIFDDNRVRIIIGLFQNTLQQFIDQFSTTNQIVIHCDADLYSSTMFVLCKMDSLIVPGTIILFDDFSSTLHDFRALDDYSSAFYRKYKVLGVAGQSYDHIAIQIIT